MPILRVERLRACALESAEVMHRSRPQSFGWCASSATTVWVSPFRTRPRGGFVLRPWLVAVGGTGELQSVGMFNGSIFEVGGRKMTGCRVTERCGRRARARKHDRGRSVRERVRGAFFTFFSSLLRASELLFTSLL